MAEPHGEDRQIKYHFEYDPAYRIVAANSAWIAITTRNDLRLDFTVEGLDNPDEIVNLITPDNQVGPELRRSPEPRLVRRLQVGVLLSFETAVSIADLIKKQIEDHLRTLRKEGTEGASGS